MTAVPEGGLTRALAVRALLYFALWIVVDQSAKPANLVFGLLTSAAATWASVKLLPPASGRVRLGLLPIAPTVFWGPMAFAIMGGLLVATLLTLVFLPTLYMTVFGNEKTPMADAVAVEQSS